MRNPYEILGIRENASKDEVSKAYKELAKKYHPDQYGANPLKDLAEDKMKEINEAYNYLMKNAPESSSYGNSSSYSNPFNNSYKGSPNYEEIRRDINMGNLSEAEAKLRGTNLRDAEWHYLNGLVALRKGWYDSAYTNINTACRLDPNNFEYREALNKMNFNNDSYRGSYRNHRNDSPDFCRICATIWCMDSCCECCGGDCI